MAMSQTVAEAKEQEEDGAHRGRWLPRQYSAGVGVAPEHRPTREVASYTAHPPRLHVGVAPSTVPPTSTKYRKKKKPNVITFKALTEEVHM